MAEPQTRRGRRQAARRNSRLNVIGVVGELFITAGVLVFLFLGWQLWLNDIIVGEEQNASGQELAAVWDEGNPRIDLPTEEPEVDWGDPIVPAKVGFAEPFAVMYVPRFGETYSRTVAESVDLGSVLNRKDKGIGHYSDTQRPGELGNFAVAAHRTTYGAPFNQIANLQVGDKIYVETADGYFTYVFRNLEYVWPTGVGVLNPVPQAGATVEANDRYLTMTSCNPLFSAAERIIAYAVFDSWQPRDAGAPEAIITAKGQG